MRRPFVFLTVSTVSMFAGALLTIACDKEKSRVEKLADQMAASASAAKSVVDAAPDPAELKYNERKKALESTVLDMKQREAQIMAKDPAATPGVLRGYFVSGDEGEKAAKELEEKRKKDGADGYRLKLSKISDTRLKDTFEDAEVDVMEETTAKGVSACLLLGQKWKHVGEKWLLEKQLSVKKVDCE
jgi:hypothetical protein